MALVLGIDVGTSSTKALLLAEDGAVRGLGTAGYPLSTPHPRWVEQDPADWWSGTCEAVRRALDAASCDAGEVAVVGLSGQMNGAVFVDAKGRPLRPGIIWLDHRATDECRLMDERAGDALRASACNPPMPVYTAAKVLWVMRHEPDVWKAAAKFIQPKDYVRFRLTGTLGTDLSDASATLLCDLRRRAWATDIFEGLGVRPDLFPELAEPTAVVGEVTAEAADATGLAAGTPMVAGGADMACMVAGSGVVVPGVVSVTIGTAGHVTTCADHVSEAGYNCLWPMCHVVPGQYFWLGCCYTGGASLQWFRDALGGAEVAAADLAGLDAFDLLAREAAQAAPGAEGLYFLPYLAGSATPHPDDDARGCFIGLTLRHRKAHLVRAILEGVAYNLRDSLEVFQKLGLALDEVRVGEGGGSNPLWRQILADVFGRAVHPLLTGDASAVGAALVAGVGTGVWPDFASACAGAVRVGDPTEPVGAHAASYERGYRLYSRLYGDLREAFAAMGKVAAEADG